MDIYTILIITIGTIALFFGGVVIYIVIKEIISQNVVRADYVFFTCGLTLAILMIVLGSIGIYAPFYYGFL